MLQTRDRLSIPMHQVDAHNVVPVWDASDKKETAARTIRKKIHTKLPIYLTVLTDSHTDFLASFVLRKYHHPLLQAAVHPLLHSLLISCPTCLWYHPWLQAAAHSLCMVY